MIFVCFTILLRILVVGANMSNIFFVYLICGVITILMMSVEVLFQGISDNETKTEAERKRARKKIKTAKLIKNVMPVLAIVYLLFLMLSSYE